MQFQVQDIGQVVVSAQQKESRRPMFLWISRDIDGLQLCRLKREIVLEGIYQQREDRLFERLAVDLSATLKIGPPNISWMDRFPT